MSNPAYVTMCIALARQTLTETVNVSDTVRKYWSERLDAVEAGLNWAPNPQGYILKGLAPSGRRACTIDGISYTSQQFTQRQFAYALQQGYMGNIDEMLRKVSQANILNGVFYSAARGDSQYGSKDARKSGYIAETMETTKKGKKELAVLVERMEVAPSRVGKAIGLQSFNERLQALIDAQAKRQAPKKAPEVEKPIEKLEVTKTVRKSKGSKAA